MQAILLRLSKFVKVTNLIKFVSFGVHWLSDFWSGGRHGVESVKINVLMLKKLRDMQYSQAAVIYAGMVLRVLWCERGSMGSRFPLGECHFFLRITAGILGTLV